jgi:hypothetical protein
MTTAEMGVIATGAAGMRFAETAIETGAATMSAETVIVMADAETMGETDVREMDNHVKEEGIAELVKADGIAVMDVPSRRL